MRLLYEKFGIADFYSYLCDMKRTITIKLTNDGIESLSKKSGYTPSSATSEILRNCIDSYIRMNSDEWKVETGINKKDNYFFVRDYAEGMSYDDLANRFFQVGSSLDANNSKTSGKYSFGKFATMYLCDFKKNGYVEVLTRDLICIWKGGAEIDVNESQDYVKGTEIRIYNPVINDEAFSDIMLYEMPTTFYPVYSRNKDKVAFFYNRKKVVFEDPLYEEEIRENFIPDASIFVKGEKECTKIDGRTITLPYRVSNLKALSSAGISVHRFDSSPYRYGKGCGVEVANRSGIYFTYNGLSYVCFGCDTKGIFPFERQPSMAGIRCEIDLDKDVAETFGITSNKAFLTYDDVKNETGIVRALHEIGKIVTDMMSHNYGDATVKDKNKYNGEKLPLIDNTFVGFNMSDDFYGDSEDDILRISHKDAQGVDILFNSKRKDVFIKSQEQLVASCYVKNIVSFYNALVCLRRDGVGVKYLDAFEKSFFANLKK